MTLAIFMEALGDLIETYDHASIDKMNRITNGLTIVLTSMVIIANIAAIVLLVVLHKQSKRPRNVEERYKSYKHTVGTVVSVEKVAYYIKRYVKKDTLSEYDLDGNKKKKLEELRAAAGMDPVSPVERSGIDGVVLKSEEKISQEKSETPLEIRKFRYKVFYEFTVTETGNLYTGECYVYDPNAVNPGDIIEVTYKPDDPMINFTDYSMPVGYIAK